MNSYVNREILGYINRLLKQFKVVLVTGARQVGKSTMLKNELPTYRYETLENPTIMNMVSEDSMLLFRPENIPLIINEVQKLPGLFQDIKFIVDERNEYGQIMLTGSQTYELMQGITESLAGRIAITRMLGLSLRELSNTITGKKFLPSPIKIQAYERKFSDSKIWKIIQRGCMPELQNENISTDDFWANYITSYIERDVRSLINIKDERKFYDFLVTCAARTGTIFNASAISNLIDVSYKTVQEWCSLLEASGLAMLLHPISTNITSRVTKSPKLYFTDTGLVSYLGRWNTPEQLENGAIKGQIFETFVFSEIAKSYLNSGGNIRDLWFYRDAKKHEIDIVIQDGHTLYPIEIKAGITYSTKTVKNFSQLNNIKDYKVGFGNVICLTDHPYYLNEDVQVIPVDAI